MKRVKIAAACALVIAMLLSGVNMHYERIGLAMGTVIKLQATGLNARAAVEESYIEIQRLEEKIKRDIKKLEESAGKEELVRISPELMEILELSLKYSRLTGGAFDVTIGAAVDLWDSTKARVPTADEINQVKKIIGYKYLHLQGGSARLEKAGMKINVGGVAKGYAADKCRAIYERHGIRDGLIDIGSSTIYAIGKKRIGLRSPREEKVMEVLEIKDSALSSSGDYMKYFIFNGKRYHHIINPGTCEPADNGVMGVSVVVSGKNSAAVADILSTAFLVLSDK